MKSKVFHIPCAIVLLILAILSFRSINAAEKEERSLNAAENEEPWKPGQLLAPADLARTISDPAAKQPLVFSIGPGAVIKGSIDIGPARDTSNINKLKKQLSQLPKDANIVIYCGCCPFEHCPNIRPAFTLLNEMKFTHPQLLNIEHNIKKDWIDKGFPVAK